MTQLSFNEDGTITLPREIAKDLEKRGKGVLDIWEEVGERSEGKKYNMGDDVSGFNLYRNGSRLDALKFSNGKNQGDIVREVVDCIKEGKKVILIRGVCGTGKSLIALNVAKELGNASIIVPGKALQKQYFKDYSSESYVLKKDHTKLKIKVISGRNNHRCLYCSDCSADDSLLPCKIEIKESNFNKLQEYIRENPKVKNNLTLKEIRRMSVAPICPYWSPIVPAEMDLNLGGEKRTYVGLKGIKFILYNRKKGCSYYNQFNSYLDSEAIIFNSAKYKLESVMNRKPATEVEIIDECDEFLDSFSNISRINFNRFSSALMNIFPDDESVTFVLEKLFKLVQDILRDEDVKNSVDSELIFEMKASPIYELFRILLDNSKLIDSIDDDGNYCHNVYEIARDFEEFFDDSFVSFSSDERGISASVVTTNLAKKFGDLLDKNKAIVLMSGTLHSGEVLKNIFGIDDFVVIDAEIVNQGKMEIMRTGSEIDCSYRNFKSGVYSRENYLRALDKAIEKSVKPSLVHVNAFDDLPSDDEKFRFGLDNLISKQKLHELQKEQGEVEKFKLGLIDVLFTTKCNRGVDFPKEQCNSIVFTKYPNPNVRSVFWKILNRTHPGYYWAFYKDKARREFLQKIYRGVRSDDDHVFILSPDSRVLDAVRFIEI